MDYRELRLGVVFFFLASWLLAAVVVGHNDHGVHKNYLILVRRPYEYDRRVYKDVSSWHASLLASVCDQAKEELEADPGNAPRLIYSYRNVVNGFSARLTTEELGKMVQAEWFVKAVPEKTYQLMTTHTPRMLGLTGPTIFHSGVWNRSNMGEGIIIGVLDGGITPGHPSFDGTGMPPPPAKWKGRCDFNSSACNNKLIGARSLFESARWNWKGGDDPVLPIDESEHGTHTSSTAVILRSARAATRGSFNYWPALDRIPAQFSPRARVISIDPFRDATPTRRRSKRTRPTTRARMMRPRRSVNSTGTRPG